MPIIQCFKFKILDSPFVMWQWAVFLLCSWKSSSFKSGDKLCVSNYWPISILPVICKIYAKVVAEQLMEHLEHMHYIHASLDLGKILHRVCVLLLTRVVLGAIFLDLRKAFDTVNHQLLISKSVVFFLLTQTQ